jgi:protein-tyrosine sulfotransferase
LCGPRLQDGYRNLRSVASAKAPRFRPRGRFAVATVYPESLHRMHTLAVAVKSIVPFGRYPIHRNEPYSPFFIIGAGRSGNTLLRRVLTAHPALHIPPETYVLGKIAKKFRQVSHMDWSDIVLFIYAFFQFHEEFETFDMDLSELVRTVRSVKQNQRSLAFIINAFYEWHAQQLGIIFQRWGDKTPLNVYALNRIQRSFPGHSSFTSCAMAAT